jgi:glucans biosynthesis protein
VITAQGDAEIAGVSLFALPQGGGSRVTFLLTPGPIDACDLRLVLRDAAGTAAGPVWLHRWTRARDGGV